MSSERCPLLDKDLGIREGWPVDIPETCESQCADRMDSAGREAGTWDDYLRGEEVPDGEVEFSHSAIAIDSLKNPSLRQYRVVDVVHSEQGTMEIGETTYLFECPHSSV